MLNWKQPGKRALILFSLYGLLLLASHLVIAIRGEDDEVGGGSGVQLEEGWLSYYEWGERKGVPLILSHGSPGNGDLGAFASELSADRWVISPDRWGFGNSEKRVADYSFVADARALVDLMDQLGIERADIMGWSYGGAVALEMADRWPERVRSVGLLGGLGIEEGEGSGSYWVEHGKYAALWMGIVAAPELIPHFGLMGPRWFRRSAVRDFWDADQRPIRGIMRRLKVPLLIVHGISDPLIPAWVAEEHHELAPGSRLAILEGSHFFPMGMEGMNSAVREVNDFVGKVERGEAVGGTNYETSRKKMRALWKGGPEVRGWKPWWLVASLAALGGWWRGRWLAILVGLGGGLLVWDGLTAFLGLVITAQIRRKGWEWLKVFGIFIAGSCGGGLLMAVI